MPKPTQLEQCIEEYLDSRASAGAAQNTLKNIRITLRGLLTSVGNIQTRNVTARHVDIYFTDAGRTRSGAVLNNDLATLSKFFRWCRTRGYMPKDVDPCAERQPRKVLPKDRQRLSPAQFAPLLEAAGRRHPRDRILVALGLYLFLRQSEIATIRISDVRLDLAEVSVIIHKTGDRDVMPISAELEAELRQYLTWYAREHGTLDPEWYLVPAKHGPEWQQDEHGRLQVTPGVYSKLKPRARMTRPQDHVKLALLDIDFPIADEEGRSTFEGVHTLRRSGARALFDELASRGYDGALQRVRAMLHHANGTMTEKYLGINVERKQRNEAIKGLPLFPSLAEAQAQVVPIGRVAGGQEASPNAGLRLQQAHGR